MRQLFRKERLWRSHDLKKSYDVVIVGVGVHGLATAYYLGKKHGIRRVALLEKGYLGSGNSGRNTAILRANYRTPQGISFYAQALKLYEEMSQELSWNVLFNQCGHLTLAHADSAVTGLRVRAENNKLLGVDSRVIYREELRQLVPSLDLSDRSRYPVLAGLYHPPGGIIRHDAVVWGYARACDRMGIEIHPFTEVTGINVSNGAVNEVVTNRGVIATRAVANCTAGWATLICNMVNMPLQITTHPLQACVTESMKPLLDKVIVSASLHVYINQTDRGELVIGAEIDPYQSYSMKGTLPTLEQMATYTLELFPQLHGVKVLRQWAGICDMTPDFAPIIGAANGGASNGGASNGAGPRGFYLNVGWGTYGFKAAPIAGKCLAELIATQKVPALIEPFSPARFSEDRLVGEKAAAAVSH